MIVAVDLVEVEALLNCDEPTPFSDLLSSGACFDDTKLARLRFVTDDWVAEDADLLRFDEAIHRIEDARIHFCLVLEGKHVPNHVVTEVLTRYQRLLPLSDKGNSCSVLEVIEPHRALFDLSKPLVRADYDHALDTWRWVLRLEPNASVELQLAALLHDIERLVSEADKRIEHLASDYLQFKFRHAAASAAYLTQFLTRFGFGPGVIRRACELVSLHEQPQQDRELAILNDADSLSFFSLNSWGFVRYFGEEHTRTKVRYTLGRMSREAQALLPTMRQHPCVSKYLRQYAERLS